MIHVVLLLAVVVAYYRTEPSVMDGSMDWFQVAITAATYALFVAAGAAYSAYHTESPLSIHLSSI
jgi:hypothetical protein